MSTLYDNTSFPALGPVSFSPWNFDCLNVNGYNFMKVPLKGVGGTVTDPTLTTAADTRTGVWFPQEGQVGITLFGYSSFVFKWSALEIIDTYGNVGTLEESITGNRTWTLPDRTGTVQLKQDTIGETPTPSPDGSTTTFTLSNNALYIIDLQYNGLGGNPYTFTTGANTFSVYPAPLSTDTLKVIYIRQ